MRLTSLALAAAFTLLSAGCSGGVIIVSPSGTSVAVVAPVTVSVSAGPRDHAAFVNHGCQGRSFVTPAFDVIVVASTTVDVDRLTLQLIDGSHMGGPTVTIPQAELTRQFGTVVIIGGTRRVFTVHPHDACDWTSWRSVSAEVAVRDRQGTPYLVTAHSPMP